MKKLLLENYENDVFLAVDDVSAVRIMLRTMLRNLGVKTVLTASDGEEAFEKIKKEQVDFVVCDWQMPVISGIELLMTLRSMESYKRIPFLMVSGVVDEKKIMQAGESEIDGYLTKPFSEQQLGKAVHAVLMKREKLSQLEVELGMVEVYLKSGKREQAYAEAERLMREYPKSARVANVLGNVLSSIGKKKEAIDVLKRAIQLNPLYLRSYESLGDVYKAKGDLDHALEMYEKASEVSPLNVKRQMNIGKIYLDKDRVDKAKVAFDAAQRAIDNETRSIREEIADAYYKSGHPEEAMEIYQTFLDKDGNDVVALNKMGITLRKMKKYKEAIHHYERALMIDNQDEVLLFNLGVACYEYKKRDDAIRYFKQALELNPEFAEAKGMLARVTGT